MVENLDKFIVKDVPFKLAFGTSVINSHHFILHCVDKETLKDYFEKTVEFEERGESLRYVRYLYTKVEEKDLKDYFNGKISFLDLLNLNEEVYLITYIETWLRIHAYQFYKCNVRDLPKKYLPNINSFYIKPEYGEDCKAKNIINFKKYFFKQ